MIHPGILVALLSLASSEPRAYLEHYRQPIHATILLSAVTDGLDPFVLHALLYVESGLSPSARNRVTGALGIAQFTRGGRAAVSRLQGRTFTAAMALEPHTAVRAASRFLRHLTHYCGGISYALAAYNSGKCRGRRVFIRAVLGKAAELRARAGLHPRYRRGR